MAERERDLFAISDVDDIENMYLTFDVRGEEYAVNIAYVTEIVGLQRISEVPDVPPFIKGVINLRGQVIPVMDMRLRFGLPWREYDDRTPIIVLELDDALTGLVVDRVTDVVSIQPENVTSSPRWRETEETPIVKGLGRRDDARSSEAGVSIILDVPCLLSTQDERLQLPQEALRLSTAAHEMNAEESPPNAS